MNVNWKPWIYKLKWHEENPREKEYTSTGYREDLYIMEQIIQETGEARESFTMLSMFGDYLKPLEAMFPTQTEKIEAIFASQAVKRGLRSPL